MKRNFAIFIISIGLLTSMGCAALREIAQEIPNVQPQAEITAVGALVKDIIENPYDDLIAVGVGYAAALLRRLYKKKKGSKG